MPARIQDLCSARWIAAVRKRLGLTQGAFGEVVGAGGAEGDPRDTVAKWEGGTEPRFTYTRRIVTIAPPELLAAFVGRPALGPAGPGIGPLDAEYAVITVPPHKGETPMHSREGEFIAGSLDEISDPHLRARAMEACSAAVRKVLNPPMLGAGRPGRAQRK